MATMGRTGSLTEFLLAPGRGSRDGMDGPGAGVITALAFMAGAVGMTMMDGMTGAAGATETHGATEADGAGARDGVAVETEGTTVADMTTEGTQVDLRGCRAAITG